MHTDSWQAMLGYPALFSAPWVIAIVWLLRRTPPGDTTPAPSLGELARRRLNIR
ncbi:MAG TPA: hypothetical protein VGF46_00345 [Gaiellales bacterium]|jgi:hypothetical protein